MSSLTVGSGMKRIASRDRLKQLVSLSGHQTSGNHSLAAPEPQQTGVIGRFTVLTDVGGLGSSPGSERMRRVSSSSSIASQGENFESEKKRTQRVCVELSIVFPTHCLVECWNVAKVPDTFARMLWAEASSS